MQGHPSGGAIDLTQYKQMKVRTDVVRLTRRLLASAVHMDIPQPESPEPFVVVCVDDTLVVSPILSAFELRLAAYGAALRMVKRSDDPFVAWTARQLRNITGLMG